MRYGWFIPITINAKTLMVDIQVLKHILFLLSWENRFRLMLKVNAGYTGKS